METIEHPVNPHLGKGNVSPTFTTRDIW